MRKVLETILRELVEFPNRLSLTEVQGAKTALFEITCEKSDIGKIIGKNGKTITAIRGMLNALGSRNGRRAVVEIVE